MFPTYNSFRLITSHIPIFKNQMSHNYKSPTHDGLLLMSLVLKIICIFGGWVTVVNRTLPTLLFMYVASSIDGQIQ